MGADSGGGGEAVRAPSRAWTRPGSVQSPQDDDGMLPLDDLHLHHYCAVWPYRPDDDPPVDPDESTDATPPIRFLSGIARTGLRHTPLIVLLVTVVFAASAELVDGVQGVSVFLPAVSAPVIGGFLVVIGLYAVLVLLLLHIGILDLRELYKASVVFGLLAVLVVGTVVSIAIVMLDPSLAAERNIVFTSGYLLMLLLAGLLVYDGMLRTEHMFERLPVTGVVADADRYAAFKRRLAVELRHVMLDRELSVAGRTYRLRVPTAYVFAVLFVSQYAVLWSVGVGPQNLDFQVTLWGNVLLNLFIVAVFFQFVVLMNRFYGLVTDDLADGPAGSALTYRPFHPDGHGGYRDFGKFATRVNLLLILAGFYSLYRLVVQGSRVSPGEMAPGFDPLVGTLVWTASFVVPLVVYAIAAVGWFYYSFWQLHLRMLRERERSYLAATDTFDDAADWEIRTQGPTWPTDFNQLVSIVSGTVAPVVFFLLEVIR